MFETLTVTETWQSNGDAVHWTARQGRKVVASVESPRQLGMFDSGILRRAVAEAFQVPEGAINHERKRSDAHRIVPRLLHVAW